MRTSSKKTTAAVLRSILGIKDFEMAELLERSPSTIHSIESGRLRLSEELATKMFHETGISPGWLLQGDPKKAPEAANGKPYTKAVFEHAQAMKIFSDRLQDRQFSADFLGFAGRLRSILEQGNRQKAYSVRAYKVARFLDALAKEYGVVIANPPFSAHFIPAIKGDLQVGERLLKSTKSKPPASKRSSRKRKA